MVPEYVSASGTQPSSEKNKPREAEYDNGHSEPSLASLISTFLQALGQVLSVFHRSDLIPRPNALQAAWTGEEAYPFGSAVFAISSQH
ncbi:unnamed protein product [Sphagnum tenellum]